MLNSARKKILAMFMVTAILILSVCAVGFTARAAGEVTAVTITADATLSGKVAELKLTKTLAKAEQEVVDPLEIYVDYNRVYRGDFGASILLDTTVLKNGLSREIKAIYTTSAGAVTSSITVAINNGEGGDAVNDPVTVITPQNIVDMKYKTSMTAALEDIGGKKYAKITSGAANATMEHHGMASINLGDKGDLRKVEMAVKLNGLAPATGMDVRFRVRNAKNSTDKDYNEGAFDYLGAELKVAEFSHDFRTGTNVPSERATAYGNAVVVDMLLSLRGNAESAIFEYIIIGSYSSKPIAVKNGAPKVVGNANIDIDLFTQKNNVAFTIDANGNAINLVSGPFAADGATVIDSELQIVSSNYEVSAGVTANESVVIKLDYLKKLPVGNKYFRVKNTDGTVLVGINISDTTPISVTSVSITNKITSSVAGDTHSFDLSILPANATAPKTVWTVSDATQAIINESTGAIKFLKAGEVTVTVTVIGKTSAGVDATPIIDTCAITVEQLPIVPIIQSPSYNAMVKNGVLFKLGKQVNDEQDGLKQMRIYAANILVYAGDFIPVFGLDTTVFPNGLTPIKVELVSNSGRVGSARTQISIANENSAIYYPSFADLASFSMPQQAFDPKITPIFDDIDTNKQLGVEFRGNNGLGHFFSSSFHVDMTKADDTIVSLNILKYTARETDSKIGTQLVFKPFGSIKNDTGLYCLIDLKQAGCSSMSLKDIMDRELAEKRISQAFYDEAMTLTNIEVYLNLFAENGAVAVIDNYSINKKFVSTRTDFAAYNAKRLFNEVKGGNMKSYKLAQRDGIEYFTVTSDAAGQQSEGAVPSAMFNIDFGSTENLIDPCVTIKTGNVGANFDVRFKVAGEENFDYLFADQARGGTYNLRTTTSGIAAGTRGAYTGIKKVEFFVSLRAIGSVEFESLAVGKVAAEGDEVLANGIVSVRKAPTITSEATKAFDKYNNNQDVSFTIDSDGLDITVSGDYITAKDYSFVGSTLTIKSYYLEALAVGSHVFTINNGIGEVTATITVTNSAPLAPTIIGETVASFDKTTPSDVVFQINLNGAVGKVTGSAITDTDYTIVGNTLTIKKEFLAEIAMGERTFVINTDGGKVSVKVNVVKTENNKKTGCGSSAFTKDASSMNGLVVGLLILVGCVLLLKKRNKAK